MQFAFISKPNASQDLMIAEILVVDESSIFFPGLHKKAGKTEKCYSFISRLCY